MEAASRKKAREAKQEAVLQALKRDDAISLRFLFLNASVQQAIVFGMVSMLTAILAQVSAAYFNNWSRIVLLLSSITFWIVILVILDWFVLKFKFFFWILQTDLTLKLDETIDATLPWFPHKGDRPLGAAIHLDSLRCCKWILEESFKKMDQDLKKNGQDEIEGLKRLAEVDQVRFTAVFLASYLGKIRILRYLLSTKLKQLVDYPNQLDKRPPLHGAILRQQHEAVNVLINEGGADPNAFNVVS
jgi:hypothetical protein